MAPSFINGNPGGLFLMAGPLRKWSLHAGNRHRWRRTMADHVETSARAFAITFEGRLESATH